MHGGIALRGSCEALPIPLWVRWCGATSIAANIALANAAAAQKRLRRRARVQPCMAVNVSCSDGAEVRNRSSYSLTLMTYLSKRALRINRLSTRYGLADAGVSDGDGGSSRQIPLAASDVLRPLSIRRLRRAWRWVLAARPARYSSMPFVASGVKLFGSASHLLPDQDSVPPPCRMMVVSVLVLVMRGCRGTWSPGVDTLRDTGPGVAARKFRPLRHCRGEAYGSQRQRCSGNAPISMSSPGP